MTRIVITDPEKIAKFKKWVDDDRKRQEKRWEEFYIRNADTLEKLRAEAAEMRAKGISMKTNY